MRLLDRLRHGGADVRKIASGEVVEPVGVRLLKGNGVAVVGSRKAHHSLHHRARTVLNVLTHGVQICSVLNGGGENADAVFALALAEKLLPPLRHEAEARLVAGEDLDIMPVFIEALPRGGVLPRGVVDASVVELGKLLNGGVDDLSHVDAGDRHRQQPHGAQNAVAPADVVGNDEGLPAELVAQLLEDALVRVRGLEYMLVCLVAVFPVQKLAEDAEGDGGLKRRAGLGDDVHIEVRIAQKLDSAAERVRGDAVADKEYPRVVLAGDGLQKLYRAASAGPAYADNNERFGARAYLLRRGDYLVELIVLYAAGQVEPARKLASRTGLVEQHFIRPLGGFIIRTVAKKPRSAGQIDFDHGVHSFLSV